MDRRHILGATGGAVALAVLSQSTLRGFRGAGFQDDVQALPPAILVNGPRLIAPNVPVPVQVEIHAQDLKSQIASVDLRAVGSVLPGIGRFAPRLPSAFVNLFWYLRFVQECRLGIEVTMTDRSHHFGHFDILFAVV